VCEVGRFGIPICEANRINVPLCEIDRATALCCEESRKYAEAQCRISGPANVQSLIQTFQVACSVATSIAKSALKSYATGAVLGFVADIAEIQEVLETVQKVSYKFLCSFQGAELTESSGYGQYINNTEGGQQLSAEGPRNFYPAAGVPCR
jgi:hypothetical protein